MTDCTGFVGRRTVGLDRDLGLSLLYGRAPAPCAVAHVVFCFSPESLSARRSFDMKRRSIAPSTETTWTGTARD